MSSQLITSLQNAAGRNRELLAILSQTDYAPTASKQNTAYISDLQDQISKTDQDIKRLHRTTEDERKDHVKYENSTFSRYMHKLGGKKGEAKFAAKAEKEEREFMEAWQKEREAQNSLAELKKALQTAEQEQQRLQTETSRHDGAQRELDSLYSSIFSGPTPEVPGEDQLEASLQHNKAWSDDCTNNVNLQRRAAEALHAALQALERASRNMAEALDMSRMDMWGGGTFTDMMERDALSRAQVEVTESLRHMDEARRCQPAIPQLSGINIDHGHMISDVFFDNIFSDMAQHDRIKNSNTQLQQAISQCKDLLDKQKRTFQDAVRKSRDADDATANSRLELQRIRAEAFERFACGYSAAGFAALPPPSFENAVGQVPPPPY